MLKFHNNLSGKLEEFQPLKDNHVGMYICGPTVWNYAHIGNFRSFTFGDILRRYLKYKGFEVTHVMNLTDVDDRIINEASKKGVSIDEFTAPFIKAFWEDCDALGLERPEVTPRATEHIAEMIDIIQTLLDNDHAYEAGGSIYYRISAFPEYGKLSKINFAGNIVGGGGRVDTDKYDKENAQDFALWKFVAEDEPTGWDAPFGRGRPGWHIECSAMAMKYLGETFDIHAGGIDLQFPHHENEIAQSEGATGKLFAKTWLHGEFLKIDGEKMAKSLGNEFTLRDILSSGFSPLAIRYLLISVPYNNQLNFTFEGLKGAETTVKKLADFRQRIYESLSISGSDNYIRDISTRAIKDFVESMDDDLNTAVALSIIHHYISQINIYLSRREVMWDENKKIILKTIYEFNKVLGIFPNINTKEQDIQVSQFFEDYKAARHNQDDTKSMALRGILLAYGYNVLDTDSLENEPLLVPIEQLIILDDEVERLIEERQEARRQRNFARSDEIRNTLLEKGIVLEDTKDGVRWKRK